jgi:hypothetical protein
LEEFTMWQSNALCPPHDESLRRALRAALDPVAREPLPQAFQDMLRRLSARDAVQNSAEAVTAELRGGSR